MLMISGVMEPESDHAPSVAGSPADFEELRGAYRAAQEIMASLEALEEAITLSHPK
jgi:hypothetical protein